MMHWNARAKRSLARGATALLLGLAGCTGSISEEPGKREGPRPAPGASPAEGPAKGSPVVPDRELPSSTRAADGFTIECGPNKACEGEDSPLRRLSNHEYLNTVRDLLGTQSDPTQAFAAETVIDGFDNNALTQLATEQIAQQYHAAARTLAAEVLPRVETLVACDAASAGERPCAETFVEGFGKRAFRRPLQASEKDIFLRLYDKAKGTGTHAESLAALVEAFLTSPQFLYRMELTGRTAGQAKPGEALPLDGWEIASRLSYMLWQTMPDAELMEAAEAGRLRTIEQIAAQARRLLAADRARDAMKRFFTSWLELDTFRDVEKDPMVYPEFTAEVKTELVAEVEAFIDHVFWERKGNLKDLIAGPTSLRNAKLAAFYGDGLGAGPALAPVDLSRGKRRGLLGTGGMAAKLATVHDSDPVKRGLFVREKLLCGHIPDAPPDVMDIAPKPDPAATKRERFEVHTNIGGCDVCHKLIDPIGLGLENLDGIGRWRDTEKGKPIITAGQWAPEDGGGTFTDSVGMLESLAENPRVYDCAVKTWMRYALGRSEIKRDLPTMTKLYERLRTSSDMHELVLDIVQSDTFTKRVVAP
jgi:hypothetical protein